LSRASSPGAQRERAFTLVELLAVIGIIAILIAVLVPTVISVRRSAEKNAARMDLQSIGVALEAYKADFKDYPRPPDSQRKYRVLAWALIGPYDTVGSVTDPFNTTQLLVDGADGQGFRTQYNSTTKTGGKVWGPYLAADKFKLLTAVENPDFTLTPADLRWDVADRYGAPIEYYPRWRGKSNPVGAPPQALFGTSPATAQTALYDYQQQWLAKPASDTPNKDYGAVQYLRKALGDDDNSDVLNGGESLKDTPPFLLLSRGPSKVFSPLTKIQTQFEKCDEITNLQH